MAHSAPILRFAGGTLVLEGVLPAEMGRLPDGGGWRWDQRLAAYRQDALAYPRVLDDLRWAGIAPRDEVPGWQTVAWPRIALRPPRPEQAEAVAACMARRRACLVMPAGTGKTEVALHIMARIGTSTLVVAPVRDLMYQWHARILAGLGYEAGILADGRCEVAPVTVTTYESAYLHMERLGRQFALIVFDECHHLPGPAYRDAARMSAAPLRLGLTATPVRADGRHRDLDGLIGPVAYELPWGAARGGTLAEYDIVRIPVHLSAGERARHAGLSRAVRGYMAGRRGADPRAAWQRLLAAADRDPAARRVLAAFRALRAIEDRADEKLRVLEDLFPLHAGEPCLVFTGSNAMACEVSRRFLIPCLLNHCRREERQEVLAGLASGVYPAVVANRVLDEGIDVPEVKVAVVLGGIASGRQAVQRLGRILRRAGNTRAVLYEVVVAQTSEPRRRARGRRGEPFSLLIFAPAMIQAATTS